MNIFLAFLVCVCFHSFAMGASHRVKTNKNFADMLLEVKAEGMTQMQMDASAETQMKMLRQCGEDCIKSVLKEAKDFHANALSTGQCMYTTDEVTKNHIWTLTACQLPMKKRVTKLAKCGSKT